MTQKHLPTKERGRICSASPSLRLNENRRSKLKWPEWIVGDFEAAFTSFFGAESEPKKVDGDMFFSAPKSFVHNFFAAAASRRRYPATRKSGRMWSGYQLLTIGMRARLHAFEQARQECSLPITGAAFMDLTQNSSFVGTGINVNLPCLLRRSQVWSKRKRRLMLPVEALESMGIGPIYKATDYGTADDPTQAAERADAPERLPWFDQVLNMKTNISSMTLTKMRHLIGC